jgi:hypothetical protein
MTADEIKFIKYMNADTSRFSFWVIFKDNRKNPYGIKGRKELVSFFTQILGPLGERWQYEKNTQTVSIKLNNASDATMIVLQLNKN